MPSSLNPNVISVLIAAHFGTAFKGHDIKVFAAPFDTGVGAFFQINEPTIPAFKSENKMFGKGIRLLLHLQETCNLLQQLDTYQLSKVAVTQASNPALSNASNTVIFKTSFLKDVLPEIIGLKRVNSSIGEIAIQTLIAEN